ncbi:hypothetical protein Pse7367_1475 [Thalassoporum mexicanum PCC 7367]|uniref:hypothetical protein n=1 Tax=Thalassoporum mexicanum TaxID=3457544 RepID=UPI00029FAB39|nr:hypothetical protein [Pseudanabaena sp. PCC 7367]AFY69766.1 hypothetical protein Pse7367_1475 [Pseudanabaena sp. PCC 7367]
MNRFTKSFLAIAGSVVAYSWAPAAHAQPYVVYVTPSDLTTLDQVRTIVPDAFRSTVDGTQVIQAGRFNSLALADERLQLLQFSGFTAQRTGGVINPPIVNPPITNPPIVNPPITNPPIVNPPITNPPITNPTGQGRYITAVPIRGASASFTLQQVRQHFPFAAVTETRRGNYVNAGAYSSRAEAEAWSYFLRARGLDARVLYF